MSSFTINLLSAATGFAAAVWIILSVSMLRRRHWLIAIAEAILAIANIVSTIVLLLRIIGRPLELAADVNIWILVVIIFVPPLLQLMPWLETKRLLSK